MGLSGNWRNSVATEAQVANNLGRGWNPVHGHRSTPSRNIAPNRGSSVADIVPTDYTAEYLDDPAGTDAAYPYDDTDAIVWGYSIDDGTADRPGWDVKTEQFRDNTELPFPQQPAWGPYTNGIPGGTTIRDVDRGAENTKRTKVRPTETVSEGWENKRFIEQPENAVDADPAQVYMQTSMTQRDQTRAGSQAQQGRDNADRASISSRIVGMRLKIWSGGERHYDMTPRSAEERIRPWWTRTAGTADPAMLDPNAMRVREPISRTVPAEPDQGTPSGATDATYGYVSEDAIPYA